MGPFLVLAIPGISRRIHGLFLTDELNCHRATGCKLCCFCEVVGTTALEIFQTNLLVDDNPQDIINDVQGLYFLKPMSTYAVVVLAQVVEH